MGLCAQGLHHLARFRPGRCTPFLTFLDHRLIQEAHSRFIHGLQIGEAVVSTLVDLVSFRFPSPHCPWSRSCLLRPAHIIVAWGRTGGTRIRRGSAPTVWSIWAQGTSPRRKGILILRQILCLSSLQTQAAPADPHMA